MDEPTVTPKPNGVYGIRYPHQGVEGDPRNGKTDAIALEIWQNAKMIQGMTVSIERWEEFFTAVDTADDTLYDE